MKATFLLPLLTLLTPISAIHAQEEAKWVRLDRDTKNHAKNLAKLHVQTIVEQESKEATLSQGFRDSNQSAWSLISDDPSLGYPVPQGERSIYISLQEAESLNAIRFYNNGVEGSVTFRGALTREDAYSGNWSVQGSAPIQAGEKFVSVNLRGGEAQYLILTFNTVTPGRVYAFGILGAPRWKDYHLTTGGSGGVSRDKSSHGATNNLISFNLTRPEAGSVVAYTSSGNGTQINRLTDGDVITDYRFDPADPAPTVIFDLQRHVQLNRVSALFDNTANTQLEIFFLNELPESANWKGDPSIPVNFLNTVKPHKSVRVDSNRFFYADPVNVQARYVAYRFVKLDAGVANLAEIPAWVALTANPGSMGEVSFTSAPGGVQIVDLGAFSHDVSIANHGLGRGNGAGEGFGKGEMGDAFDPGVGYFGVVGNTPGKFFSNSNEDPASPIVRPFPLPDDDDERRQAVKKILGYDP